MRPLVAVTLIIVLLIPLFCYSFECTSVCCVNVIIAVWLYLSWYNNKCVYLAKPLIVFIATKKLFLALHISGDLKNLFIWCRSYSYFCSRTGFDCVVKRLRKTPLSQIAIPASCSHVLLKRRLCFLYFAS